MGNLKNRMARGGGYWKDKPILARPRIDLFIQLPYAIRIPEDSDISGFVPFEYREPNQIVRLYQRLNPQKNSELLYMSGFATRKLPENHVMNTQAGILQTLGVSADRISILHINQPLPKNWEDRDEDDAWPASRRMFDCAWATINHFQDSLAFCEHENYPRISDYYSPVLAPYIIEYPSTVRSGVLYGKTKIGKLSELKPDENDHVSDALDASNRVLKHGILDSFADTLRECVVATENRNYLVSSALAGVASEVLVRSVLEMAWWDQNLSSEDAAKKFGLGANFESVKTLVSREMGAAIGGEWNTKAPGSIAHDWALNVYDLRNKIVHGGLRPTPENSKSSLDALIAIHKEIKEAVHKSRNLPFTLYAMHSKGMHFREFERTRDKFLRWRDEVIWIQQNSKPPAKKLRQCCVLSELEVCCDLRSQDIASRRRSDKAAKNKRTHEENLKKRALALEARQS